MNFLQALTGIVTDTANAIGTKAPNRMNFFTFFTIIFGIITGLFIFGCFYIYLTSVLEYQQSVFDIFMDKNFYLLFYFSSFATPLTALFLAHYYYKKRNRLHESYSMMELMNSLDIKVILTFMASLIVIFAMTAIISENASDWFYEEYLEVDPLIVFTENVENWKLKIFFDVLLIILHLVPALVAPVYLFHLKYGAFKVLGAKKHLNALLAYLVLWVMLTLLFGFIWTILSRTVLSWISVPFEVAYIPSIINMCIFVFLSILYYRVVGYVTVYSVMQTEDEDQPNLDLEGVGDLLDQ